MNEGVQSPAPSSLGVETESNSTISENKSGSPISSTTDSEEAPLLKEEFARFYATPSKGYGYWTNWDNFVNELVVFINELYNYLPSTTPLSELREQILNALGTGVLEFPSTTTIRNYGREDIKTAFKNFGGLSGVIGKLGVLYTPSQKEKGHWQDWDTFLNELLRFINSLYNYIPTDTPDDELRTILIPALQSGTIALPTSRTYTKHGRGDLEQAFKHFGGITGVRDKLKIPISTSYKPPTKPAGYWKDWDNFVNVLVVFLNKLYNLLPPTAPQAEIRDKVLDALRKGTIEFDTSLLDKYRQVDLRTAIKRHWGGIFAVKEKLGIESSRKPRDYWSDWDNFFSELLSFVQDFNQVDPQARITPDEVLEQLRAGKLQFPFKNDLGGTGTLARAFQNFGGINTVREKLGIPPPSVRARGYWEDWDNVVNEFVLFINEFYHYLPSSTPKAEIRIKIIETLQNKTLVFPGKHKFEEGGRGDLIHAIGRHHGGLASFKGKLNIPIFYLDDPFSKSSKMHYYNIRGQKTEEIIVDLLKEWADQNVFYYTTRVPTGTGVLEFVCGEDKKYGVDVTNAKNPDTIRVKWKRRDYYKFLDELWIVVVADYPQEVFKKLNEEAPDNVLVINFRELVTFLNGLSTRNIPFSIPPEKQRKLDALAQCTFYNREQIIKQFKEKL